MFIEGVRRNKSMKGLNETKKFVVIFLFILFWLFVCLWIGKDIKPDLNNNVPDYREGGGTGHPLWKD